MPSWVCVGEGCNRKTQSSIEGLATKTRSYEEGKDMVIWRCPFIYFNNSLHSSLSSRSLSAFQSRNRKRGFWSTVTWVGLNSELRLKPEEVITWYRSRETPSGFRRSLPKPQILHTPRTRECFRVYISHKTPGLMDNSDFPFFYSILLHSRRRLSEPTRESSRIKSAPLCDQLLGAVSF